jgi:hypothetical protein
VPTDGPVAIFDSIHAVLSAERALLAAGLRCDLVPVPRGLSSDCGLALLFRNDDAATVGAILAAQPLVRRLRGIFVSGSQGYREAARD